MPNSDETDRVHEDYRFMASQSIRKAIYLANKLEIFIKQAKVTGSKANDAFSDPLQWETILREVGHGFQTAITHRDDGSYIVTSQVWVKKLDSLLDGIRECVRWYHPPSPTPID